MDTVKVLEDVNRVEVVDDQGRAYVNHGVSEVCYSLQDDGKTLKVFIRSHHPVTELDKAYKNRNEKAYPDWFDKMTAELWNKEND